MAAAVNWAGPLLLQTDHPKVVDSDPGPTTHEVRDLAKRLGAFLLAR